ncbi:unnamed protein product [Discula destructiva]
MSSGVPLFNGLKHLPCPKEAGGATCSTRGCLFGHRSGDDKPANTHAGSFPGPYTHALDGTVDEEADEDPRPAQKRQRLNPTSQTQELVANNSDVPTLAESEKDSKLYDPLSPPTVTASTPATQPSQSHSLPQAQPATTPQKASVSPISTPDSASLSQSTNSRQTNRSALSSAAAKPIAAHSLAPPLAHSSPVSKVTSPQPKAQRAAQDKTSLAKPPRKPEPLNPRHVASAPASHSVRYQLLKLLHVELVRLNGQVSAKTSNEPELKSLVQSDQELIWTVLDKEQKIATEKGPIYRNVMGQTVVAHKRMDVATYVAHCKKKLAQASPSRLRGGAGAGAESAALGSDQQPATQDSKADSAVVIDTGLTATQEIELLERLITPITDLEQHGYVSTPPTEEQIAQTAEAVGWSRNWEQCDRCNARFQIFPDGNMETGELASGGACTHHPGRAYFPQRPPGHTGFVNKKYRCCTQELNESPGCATSDCHVWKTSDPKRLAMLWNWVETPANDSPDVKKAVAFDCEMGYTVRGMELLRLTATSWPDGAELVDVLVQPFGRILDLNTKWSGVFMEDLLNGVPWTKDWEAPPQKTGDRRILRKVESPKAARDLLFSVISPDTILIGHGLENDLNAMRIIHPKIVDTILLYPHRKGLPIRTSLKNLMEVHLRRQIQIDTGEGHDSAEDARAAGDLVRLQVQTKWRSMSSEGWRFLDGMLRKPGWNNESASPEGTAALAPVPGAMASRSSEESIASEDGGAKLTVELLEAGSSQ